MVITEILYTTSIIPGYGIIVIYDFTGSHAQGCEDLNPETSSSSSLAPSTTSSSSLHSSSPSPQGDHFKGKFTPTIIVLTYNNKHVQQHASCW